MTSEGGDEAGGAREATLGAFRELASRERPGIFVMNLMLFVEIVGFAMLIPVIAFFAMVELGLNSWQVGLAMSSLGVGQLFGSWGSGRLSDTVGRRPVIVAVFAWAGLGFGVTAFVTSFAMYVVVRVVQGLSGGTWSVSDAYILDSAPAKLRAGYIGLTGACIGMGFVLGPALAMLFLYLEISRRTIFLIAGALGLAAALLGFCLLPESLPREKRRPLCGGPSESGQETASDWSAVSSGLMGVWFITFMLQLALSIMFVTYAFLIRDLFGWTDSQFALIMVSGSIVGAFTSIFIFPLLTSVVGGSARVLAICMACGAVAWALMPIRSVPVHLVATLGKVVVFSIAMPATSTLIGEYAGQQYLGFANGVKGSCTALARVLGPLLGGFLYERGPFVAYYTGSAFFCVALICAVGLACWCPASPEERKPLMQGAP